jgi:hypothetical protein
MRWRHWLTVCWQRLMCLDVRCTWHGASIVMMHSITFR